MMEIEPKLEAACVYLMSIDSRLHVDAVKQFKERECVCGWSPAASSLS